MYPSGFCKPLLYYCSVKVMRKEANQLRKVKQIGQKLVVKMNATNQILVKVNITMAILMKLEINW